jgi:phosphoribosylanthranilate isomerase
MWLKICGMTTPEAVAATLDARADAMGFVFAQSVRKVTPQIAAGLAVPARGRLRLVAVTRHPSQEELDEILRVFRPDVLQTDVADLSALRLPADLEVLPVLRGLQDMSADSGRRANSLPRILFEGQISGSGTTCDWDGAREVAQRTELILAGGLNAGNVARAVAEVQPFGVDVSSGVEERPGLKSPAEIARFVAAARAAAQITKMAQRRALCGSGDR